jgi:spore coat protein CotH
MSPRSLVTALASGTTALLLVTACGSSRADAEAVTTTAAGATSSAATSSGSAAAEGSDLFDSNVVHDLEISYDQAAYEEMIDTYVSSGDKEWIEGTVTIDGTTYEHAGLRLKGNSSLMALRRGGAAPNGAAAPRGGGNRMGGPGGSVSAEEPESLPWLIRLDKFVEGQDHDGLTSFVVRSNNTATALNEAVALELLGLSGQATQAAVASRFSVNGGSEKLRLVIENPDEVWDEDNFDTDGILYKAESGGDYSYRGDDPEAYDEIFDQETGDDDLTPLIELLDFLNNSDDATFAAELADRLDVDTFARYLAFQELIANFDDIDGPGNNSYLRYDAEDERFTVLSWDHNLAFGSMGGLRAGMTPPEGMAPPDGANPPTSDERPTIGGPGGPGGPGGAGGPPGRSNILVERFLANDELEALYQEALTDLRADLYASGAAADVLERWTGLLTAQTGDLVDAATIEQESAAVARYFTAD